MDGGKKSHRFRKAHPLWRLTRTLFLTSTVSLLILAGTAIVIIIKYPGEALVYSVNYFVPEAEFSAASVQWTSWRSVEIRDAQFGSLLKMPEVTFRWKWRRLLSRRLEELKFREATVFLDISAIEKSFTFPSRMPGPLSYLGTWYLDLLSMERGGLVMVGLAPGLPPLSVEVEGVYEKIPLGTDLSPEDLQLLRPLRLRNLTLHSPLDPAVRLLKIKEIVINFRYGNLKKRILDSIILKHPTLNVDRGLFWFIEELRKAEWQHPRGSTPVGEPWSLRHLQIRNGRLDISRLHAVSLQYPFDFEVSQKDLNLSDLSLAQFNVQLNIPNQNMYLEALGLFMKNVRGKIIFNMAEGGKLPIIASGHPPTANDLVNILYADSLQWKDFDVADPWLALTFDPEGITALYGGGFATGYMNGGANCGWSNKEAWRTWGAAADIDTEMVAETFGKSTFSMNGRASIAFDLRGMGPELAGDLKLRSLSAGTMHFFAMEKLQERIDKNTSGMRKEILQWFVESLKEYPFHEYALDVNYQRPNAHLNFRSESSLGSRKIDLNWHGPSDKE